VSGLLWGLALVLGIATAWYAVTALVQGYRAVRIGGPRLLVSGWDWIMRRDRIAPAARPYMQAALRRWVLAMLCLLLAAFAGIAADLVR
jgi:hypothetical protein